MSETTFTTVSGLDELAGDGTGTRPNISVLARLTKANVIRLSFRAGQVMADHKAGRPILVIGQRGEIDFAVSGEHITVTPGTSIHVEAEVSHALTAVTDAVVTLVLLDPGA
ncbi:cupin domain-containing protein [Gordonia sp. ABSL1-1]|uniref:cupin domain-containing protein n=1 Tax=Gordonia sp. ABSL1-1 TaxID=3053923 RepID=UPI002574337E|nr:cupin domain-containing protein [Gordonia sp. ABSL1-1]MDL9936935.1 cupin domain-containing protein [Gordonia sp. ABSL1-1]